ncbi:unnamed protein product [Caenorhabditis nigoni]
MRLPIIQILVLMSLLTVAAEEQKNDEKMKMVLRRNALSKVEISSQSREDFTTYMATFCLAVTEWEPSYFLQSYIPWEQVEFLDSLKEFLDPSNDQRMASYFNHLGHNTPNNCSMKNEKKIRDSHNEISQETLFDNYMYDQMTRLEWTPLYM